MQSCWTKRLTSLTGKYTCDFTIYTWTFYNDDVFMYANVLKKIKTENDYEQTKNIWAWNVVEKKNMNLNPN